MSRLRKHLSKKKTQTKSTESIESSVPKTRPSASTPTRRKTTRIRRNRAVDEELSVEKSSVPLNAVVSPEIVLEKERLYAIKRR